MRNLYVLIITALIVSACSNNESIEPKNSDVVNFGVYVRKTTKANTADITTLKRDGFTVLASNTADNLWEIGKTSSTPNFFYDQEVNWNESQSTWEYSPLRIWDNINDNVTFFAFSPKQNITLSARDFLGPPQLTYVCPNSPTDQKDLVVAMIKDKKEGDIDARVSFSFNHILSKVSFQAKLMRTFSGLQSVFITSLKLHYTKDCLENKMKYTFTEDNTKSSIWEELNEPSYYSSQPGGEELITTPIDLDTTPNLSKVQLNDDNKSLMLIPQDVESGDMTLTISYEVTTKLKTRTYKRKIDLSEFTMLPGKHYLIDLVISINTVKMGNITTGEWKM